MKINGFLMSKDIKVADIRDGITEDLNGGKFGPNSNLFDITSNFHYNIDIMELAQRSVIKMSNEKSKHAYDDIIDLEYPFQLKHPHMRQNDRAAQFSPFSALSGFNAAISETARLTDKRIDLDEESMENLNAKLQVISDNISEQPLITITYFLPDDKKDGGAYLTASENVKKINEYKKYIVTTTGLVVPIGDIYELKGELFDYLERIDG